MTRARVGHAQSGAVAVLVAVMLVMLLGFAALVIDIGELFRGRGELQNASDAAALAAARHLDRTPDGLIRARAAAHEYAGHHQAVGTQVEIADADIVFGHWDDAARSFTALDDAAYPSINAVKVIDRRQEASGNAVQLRLAPLIGHDTADVSSTAIAVAGGPTADCGFPMVVPDCSLDAAIADGTCDYCMTYQDNNNDNAGWTSFDTGSVGGPAIADLVKAACFASDDTVLVDPETRECTGACVRTEASNEVKINNGNLMNQGQNNFCPLIQEILTRGVDGGTAYPFVVRVPVMQSTEGTCDATQFSGTKQVAGYAAMEIFGAKCGNADPGVIAPSAPCPPPSSGKYIVAALRCDLDSEDGVAGGAYFGVDAVHVRLVQ